MEEIELSDINTSINNEKEKDVLLLNEEEKKQETSIWEKTKIYLNYFYSNTENQLTQTYHEMINRKINFGLGILSCLVVVCMVSIAQTAVGKKKIQKKN